MPEPREIAVHPNDRKDVPSLVEGPNRIRCPRDSCGKSGKPGVHFKALSRNEKYAMELNVVLIHDKDHGGCGHIFSLGEQKVLIAFLEGRLVPREMYDELREKYEALLAESGATNGQPTTEVTA